MKIDIKNQNIDISINTFGAYVEKFSYKNEPIFFPKVLSKIDNQLKARGGMHPCFPNFGKDEITDLPQHGFARNEYFEVLEQKSDFVSLKLDGVENYEGVEFFIDYILKETTLYTKLKIVNKSNKDLIFAPGFHPYFYCKDANLEIKDFDFKKEDLEATLFLDRSRVEFTSNGKNIVIDGDNVNKYAVWTDFHGEYVCVEPTYKGVAFKKDSKDYFTLSENEEFVQNFTIEII